ncbi:microfibril-associated glycoprotein 4-like isoform X2 [Eriocheir sinensis]|uniref:microfibril-associated glycoprotein 4-like isoform X2 n=1 Tax=Eriocheir sinensis TaxID=95602 RepID=UPI0021CA0105|nr:microfibril-associated glycoprotein 4-like isoform X2 [Eriocheir sinensis]
MQKLMACLHDPLWVHLVLLAVVVAQVTASASLFLPPSKEAIPLGTFEGQPNNPPDLLGLYCINKTKNRSRHCKDLLDAGDKHNGVRMIYPNPEQPDRYLMVYCDQTTDGGGWTVFQRRTNSSCSRENFSRSWGEYKMGFGNIGGEFWLGLDALHLLTSAAKQELRIDLADWEGNHRYAKYKGDAGDSLGKGNRLASPFSTYDNDNDNLPHENCAEHHRGGWWYSSCHYYSSLNGYQYKGKTITKGDGINWEHWRGFHYSLRDSAMMIRPLPYRGSSRRPCHD